MSMKIDFALGGHGNCWGNKVLLLVVRGNTGERRFCLWTLGKMLGKLDFVFGG